MRRTWFDGIAKPRPTEPACPPVVFVDAMAELMPMTWPAESSSGPPELPGLIAASVWIASMNAFPLPVSDDVVTARCSAETMPDSQSKRASSRLPVSLRSNANSTGCRPSAVMSPRLSRRPSPRISSAASPRARPTV